MKSFQYLFVATLFALLTFCGVQNICAQNKVTIPIEHFAGQILLHLQDAPSVQKAFSMLTLETSLVTFDDASIIVLAKFDPNQYDENVLLQSLRKHTSVKVAQFNHPIELRNTTPNDPDFALQWNLKNTGASGGLVGADIKAEQAWDITRGGTNTDGDTIVIAILDNGTCLTHPDLITNNWVNRAEIPNNGIDDDQNGYVDDYQGWNMARRSDEVGNGAHGCEVAGVIGASGNNGRGMAGINWKVKLMHIVSMGSEESVVASYGYALKMRKLWNSTQGRKGALVVATNTSFGRNGAFPSSTPLWCAFYDSLGAAGIVSVAAAANQSVNVEAAGDIPTTCTSPYLITVTGTNNRDNLHSNAAFGAVSVDLGAPGIGIYTTTLSGSYAAIDGTSFACPQVVGLVGLIHAVSCSNFTNYSKGNPAAAALLIKDWILRGVDAQTSLQNKTVSGGRLNLLKTLQFATAYCGVCQQPSALRVLPASNTQSIQLTWNNAATATATTARYRLVGSSAWTNIGGNVTPPLTIPNLNVCARYEVEFQNFCNGINSSTFSIIASTDGCCEATSNISLDSIGKDLVNLRFSAVSATNGYEICVKDSSNVCVFRTVTTNTQVTIASLRPCTRYTLNIKTLCADAARNGSDTTISFFTKNCGACTEVRYCNAFGRSASSEWIDTFTLNTFRQISGRNSGYADFGATNTPIVVQGGDRVSFSIRPGFLGGTPYNEAYRIWVDWNQDGDFLDSGEQMYENAGTSTRVLGTFTVPNTAFNGVTRLRVALKYVLSSDPMPLPCEQFDSGEVEDYCIKIEGGVNATTPTPVVDDNFLSVYPNPFSDDFVIEKTNGRARFERITLTTIDGRTIWQDTPNSYANRYIARALPYLPTGVYILSIGTDKGMQYRKIVKAE
jgi:serine protease